MERFLIFASFCLLFAKGQVLQANGDERISGGSLAPNGLYPFVAAMLTNGGAGDFVQECGATILTISSLLSAASCYYDSATGGAQNSDWWQARVGSLQADTEGALHAVRLITLHDNYNDETKANNVAVIRTATSIIYVTDSVEPAFIPGNTYDLPEDIPLWAVGWGVVELNGPRSNDLRHVEFWRVRQNMCISRYADLSQEVSDAVICAGWLDVGDRSQCEGDIGGPLVHNNVVVGIHSWSQDCESHQYPSLNTRVASFTSWIVRHATLTLPPVGTI